MIELDKVFKHPLTPVPLSLAHMDGSMNKTDKSKLMQKLERTLIDCRGPQHNDGTIIDAAFLLHTLQKPPATFGGVSRVILTMLCDMAEQVHLVCDTYVSPSIKDAERDRRGSEDMIYAITGADQSRPKDWHGALKSSSFKSSMFRFLALDWMKDTYAHILSNHTVVLAVDGDCFSFTEDNGKVARVAVTSLTSLHEEADTRMIYHLHYAVQREYIDNVTVRCNDTDVLIILLHYMSVSNLSTHVWMDTGLSTNNTRRTICINGLVDKLPQEVLHALPALHAFTGCDYTAAFWNKGKVRPLYLLTKNEDFRSAFAKLGTSKDVSTDVMTTCDKFVCHLYGKPLADNVDQARYRIFQQTYAPRSLDAPLAMIKGINASALPPCSMVRQNKIKRTNYVAYMWKNAHLQDPCPSNPQEHGWLTIDGRLQIKWYDGEQVPVDICQAFNGNTPQAEEEEDEEVTYGDALYGYDELDNDEFEL